MKTLSGLDGAFLHLETEATPMHVASLHRFDPPAGKKRLNFLAEIRKQLRDRLSLAPVLTRRLAPMPLQFANPVWIEDRAPNFAPFVKTYPNLVAREEAALAALAGGLRGHAACAAAGPQPPALADHGDRRPGLRPAGLLRQDPPRPAGRQSRGDAGAGAVRRHA